MSLKKLVKWARVSSPWLLHFNSGSCNGCDIEVIAALMPRFDPERFGVLLKGSPRHADVLVHRPGRHVACWRASELLGAGA
jgi:Ni,Fe-hydrogenase III small subunit